MEMYVGVASLLVVVVGFQLLSALRRKRKSGLTIELARVAGRETRDTWLDGRFGEDCVNKLLKELDSTKLDSELCTYLDTMELDENLQFLRLSADYCGRPSWKVIKYRCQLANESGSFYRCISVEDQWLHTVIQPQQQKPDIIEIRNNVVPRQAYLARLPGMHATCPGHELCPGGFSPISVLREAEHHRQSCTKCALAVQLRGEAHVDAGQEQLWDLAETDVKLVEDRPQLGEGSDGTVCKIYWRKGVFVRKEFMCAPPNDKNPDPQNGSFDKELEVAKEVSHPNIVHYFGSSIRFDFINRCYFKSLFMEWLEGDLETRLQEPIQKRDPFSFQDILDILWQVGDAMKQLHEKNFIHGDLKPGNILLSRLAMPHSKSGKFYLVKVADFGRAQRVPPEGFTEGKFAGPKSADASSGETAKTFFESLIGSTHYIAPEVFSHRKDGVPPKHPQMIDIYSFGVVAYQMLTGVTKLYEGYKPSELKEKVVHDQLRPDSNFNIGTLDRDRQSLLPLVQSCWDPIPEDRPPFSKICETLKNHPIEHGENASFHCIGDVAVKLLKVTMVGVTVGGCIQWLLRK